MVTTQFLEQRIQTIIKGCRETVTKQALVFIPFLYAVHYCTKYINRRRGSLRSSHSSDRRGTTSASIFCHRLSTHQTHQIPSKIVTLGVKYNHATRHPRLPLQESVKTISTRDSLLYLPISAIQYEGSLGYCSATPRRGIANMSLTNCRFYEEKYPEIDSFVMVNVKQV
jgi:hypothetical protein